MNMHEFRQFDEETRIGIMLLVPELAETLIYSSPPSSFVVKEHRWIAEAIHHLASNGQVPHWWRLAERLSDVPDGPVMRWDSIGPETLASLCHNLSDDGAEFAKRLLLGDATTNAQEAGF